MSNNKHWTNRVLTLTVVLSSGLLFATLNTNVFAQHADDHDAHDEHVDDDHTGHDDDAGHTVHDDHAEQGHDDDAGHTDQDDHEGSGHDDDTLGHESHDDEHGHAAGTDGHSDDEDPADHAAHAGHTEDDGHGTDPHAGHADDPHAGHNDHEDGVLQVDAANMKEFGIEVAAVGPGVLSGGIELNGEVVFNADRIAHVSPSVPGIVQEVMQAVGDHVQADQVMGVLSSRDLAAARGEYLGAKARFQLAQETLARDEKLFTNRVGTERQVMETRQAAREAEIALNLAEHNLHAFGQSHEDIEALSADDDAGFMTYHLRAPIDGVVISRHLTRGERVGEEPEEAPFVIADLSSVWVNLTVYQRDIESIKPGMKVTVRFRRGALSATGEIAFVSPSLDERTRTATARVVLDNPDGRWRPGMFVTALADHGAVRGDVVVPRSAVQYVEEATAVFVQNRDEYELRPIKVGRETPDVVEVVAGLEAGEVVVTRNGFALKAEMNRGALEHAGHAH